MLNFSGFKCGAQKFVTAVLEKMTGRCPLGYVVVRAAEHFSPSLPNEKMKDEDLQSKMKQLTMKSISLKVLQYSVGHKALLQFTEFLSKEKVTNNDQFNPRQENSTTRCSLFWWRQSSWKVPRTINYHANYICSESWPSFCWAWFQR